MKLNTSQKAELYNEGLRRYQKLQEQVRQIRANSLNLTELDEMKIAKLEQKMKEIYNKTRDLYN